MILFCQLSNVYIFFTQLTSHLAFSVLTPASSCCGMDILYQCKEILRIQKFRRIASYADFTASAPSLPMPTQAIHMSQLNHLLCTCIQNPQAFCSFLTVLPLWAYCRTRAGISRADQYYASYPAGTELLTDTAKVWIRALKFVVIIYDHKYPSPKSM
jgi:hypothetical protein